MATITCKDAYFIKLGKGGEWEQDCLDRGILRFGYHETPPDLCDQGNWDRVQQFWQDRRSDAGAATRDTTQIKIFYESNSENIFITFYGGALYWCQPNGSVDVCPDGERQKATLHGWSNKSVGGNLLSTDRLAGFLTKVQMYRGTICKVHQRDYLLRKINDQVSDEVLNAETTEKAYIEAIKTLIKHLEPKDFEILVDLVFASSGWKRTSSVGGTQPTVDFELLLPTTQERAFVQVKSNANQLTYQNYAEEFAKGTYDRMFFVWHTGNINDDMPQEGISLIGPDRFVSMVVDAGLASWVKEKVS